LNFISHIFIVIFLFSTCTNSPDWTSGECTDSSTDSNGFSNTCSNGWSNDEASQSYSYYNDCSDTEGNVDGKHKFPFHIFLHFYVLVHIFIFISLLGSTSTCTYTEDPWMSDCQDSSYHTSAYDGSSWSEDCTSHSEENAYNQTCTSPDGSSRSFDWSWDEETNAYHDEDCNTSQDGNTCCNHCTSYYDDDENWTSDCESTGECGNQGGEDGEHFEDPYEQLLYNVDQVRTVVDLCGCGSTTEATVPQDENGFIQIGEDGDNVHCDTACWVGENIVGLMVENGFVPANEANEDGIY